MRAAILVCAALAACGKKTESAGGTGSASGASPAAKPAATRFEKVKQPKVSPACEKARESFGYGAQCAETELPELATAAGKITRVVHEGDPARAWSYVLARPDGSLFAGAGGATFDEVLKVLDTAATPPEVLAKLHAALDVEAAVVRCLPGTGDTLPDKDGKPVECAPPAIRKDGDKTLLSYMLERFPHPALLGRTTHRVDASTLEVKEHDISSFEGTMVAELPRDAPLPAGSPPAPVMSTPPDWVAKPVPVADDASKAICEAAVARASEMAGRQCKPFAYPSLDTPAGALFWIANDAGLRQLLALRLPDGSIKIGYDVEATSNPLGAVVTSYDPKTMPAEKVAALYLFLQGEPVHLLCLPGSADAIPDHACDPPKVEKKGDGLMLTFIVEELPLPTKHGTRREPSVRSYAMELTSGGGSSGGGTRLLDLRDP